MGTGAHETKLWAVVLAPGSTAGDSRVVLATTERLALGLSELLLDEMPGLPEHAATVLPVTPAAELLPGWDETNLLPAHQAAVDEAYL